MYGPAWNRTVASPVCQGWGVSKTAAAAAVTTASLCMLYVARRQVTQWWQAIWFRPPGVCVEFAADENGTGHGRAQDMCHLLTAAGLQATCVETQDTEGAGPKVLGAGPAGPAGPVGPVGPAEVVRFILVPNMAVQAAASFCLLTVFATAPRLPKCRSLLDMVPQHGLGDGSVYYDMSAMLPCMPFMSAVVAECGRRFKAVGATVVVAYSTDAYMALYVAGACGLRAILAREVRSLTRASYVGLSVKRSRIENQESFNDREEVVCSVDGLQRTDVAVIMENVTKSGATKAALRQAMESPVPLCAAVHELVLINISDPGGRVTGVLADMALARGQ